MEHPHLARAEAEAKRIKAQEEEGPSYSSQLLWEKAEKRGFTHKVLSHAAKFSVIEYTDEDGDTQRCLVRNARTQLVTATGALIADDKFLTYTMAQEYKLPMPRTKLLKTEADAREYLTAYKRIVIKPADQGHGDGVTTNITTEAQIAPAMATAKLWSKKLIAQEQVQGFDYRLLIVNGRMIAAAKRLPARVIGNGHDTIEQLIVETNKTRGVGHNHTSPLTQISIADVRTFLGDHALKTVPKLGEIVNVIGTANVSRGGEAIDVTNTVHPAIRDMACKFADICGLGVCGADLMCLDITEPPELSHPYFIEFNAGPGFRMHTCPSQGQSRDVAGIILDELIAFNRRNKHGAKHSTSVKKSTSWSRQQTGAMVVAAVGAAAALAWLFKRRY